ncbi:MAG: redoxin domain-containing protein [Planctomycetota bacterium]
MLCSAMLLGLLFGVRWSASAAETLRTCDFRDVAGDTIQVAPDSVLVLAFLGTECPLARIYGPRLQRIASRFADRGVQVIGVNSNLQDSPVEIAGYRRDLALDFPIAKDADQSIARTAGATRTPEVFVIDPTGLVRYQGRVDDQYLPGKAKSTPSRRDLELAIEQILGDDNVDVARTDSVGCLITFRHEQVHALENASADVTFHRDIAPLLNRHCVECHRPGQIGPFALTEYDEVVGWGQMMLEVIDDERMPPWHADPAVGSFVGQRRVPESDRQILERWVDLGMPKGDVPAQWDSAQDHLADHAASPWHLAEVPDVELAMRERPFVVPADGVVEYQYFVVDPGWTEDKWVRAAQVVPGEPAVVHHSIVFVRPPDGSSYDGIGFLGAYVPGQRTGVFPQGYARHVPAGSKLVFQMHYTPRGREERDRSRLGIWFAEDADTTHRVTTRLAINHEFEIPPDVSDHEVHMSLRGLPSNGLLLSASPHMHLRGRSFELNSVEAQGRTTPLLRVPRYDFNWQHWYQFVEPIPCDDLTHLSMSVTFDNSKGNPVNPAPGEYVGWGDQTWEEMAIAFFDIAIPRRKSKSPSMTEPDAAKIALQQTKQARLEQEKKAGQAARAFMTSMDRDGNGVVEREETPVAFQRFGFRRYDRNRDNRLTQDEVARAVRHRHFD